MHDTFSRSRPASLSTKLRMQQTKIVPQSRAKPFPRLRWALWVILAASPGCKTLSSEEFDSLHRISMALDHARRDYILQPGDVAQVTIYRGNSVAPEYRQEVTVQPDGKITLINIEAPIDTTGMTVEMLQEKVKGVYEPEFGIEAGAPGQKFEATVQFISSTKTQWLPDQVFVTGEVRRPVSLPYRRGLTVLKAISEASGWRYTANESKIVILRIGPDGQSVAREIDCAAVVVHEAEDIVLFPGDVVFVPLSGIAKVNLFVEFYIRGLLPFNPSILRTFAFTGFSS